MVSNLNHPTLDFSGYSHILESPAAAAWLAALIDGEGTVGVYRMKFSGNRSGYKYKAEVSISNTNIQLLNQVQLLVGGSVCIDMYPTKKGHKPLYRVRLRASIMRKVLSAVLPFLVIKRQQALYVMAIRKAMEEGPVRTSDEYSEVYNRIYEECKALNRRGV